LSPLLPRSKAKDYRAHKAGGFAGFLRADSLIARIMPVFLMDVMLLVQMVQRG
jgi:hypothetical protein